jgi:hypothetical protein
MSIFVYIFLCLFVSVFGEVTKLVSSVVVDNTDDNPYTYIQSFGANSTLMSQQVHASNPDYRTLYYYVKDTSQLNWDAQSLTCGIDSMGTVENNIVTVIASSDGLDSGGINCITKNVNKHGYEHQIVCCLVENIGYVPVYQNLEDTRGTYQTINNFIPLTHTPIHSGDIPRCCTQDLWDGGTNCGCGGNCCDGTWCSSSVDGQGNFGCGIIGDNGPSYAPITQTSYPSLSPTLSPTSLSPTLSPVSTPTSLSPTSLSPVSTPTLSHVKQTSNPPYEVFIILGIFGVVLISLSALCLYVVYQNVYCMYQ